MGIDVHVIPTNLTAAMWLIDNESKIDEKVKDSPGYDTQYLGFHVYKGNVNSLKSTYRIYKSVGMSDMAIGFADVFSIEDGKKMIKVLKSIFRSLKKSPSNFKFSISR